MRVLCFWIVLLNGFIDKRVTLKIEACYGNIAPNRLVPQCNSDEIIKLNGLYAIAKKIATGCPNVYSTFDGDPVKCCTYSTEDCKVSYNGGSDYFKPCVAINTCSLPVAWQETQCNETGFLSRSNYMQMDYSCISVHDIVPITSNEVRNGPPSTLGGPGYPNNSLPADTDGICSVFVSCGTTINIVGIDINFITDGGGTCQQYIDIEDSGSNTKRIDCADNNADKKPKILYTSQGYFLILRYNNSLSVDGGRLWIEFNGTHKDAIIDIRCGTSIMTSPPSVPSCPQSTTASTPFGRPSGPRRGSESEESNSGSEQTLGPGQISGIVIGILAALILLLLLLLLLWRCKKKKTGRMKVSDSSDLLPNDEFAKALGISGKPATAGIAPLSSSLAPRRARLTPIESIGKDHGGVGKKGSETNAITPTSFITKHTMPGTDGSPQEPHNIKTAVFEIQK